MLDEYFSKRHKIRPQLNGYIYELVPESARTGLSQILDNYFQNGSLNADQLYFNISHALKSHRQNTGGKIAKLPKDTRKAIGDLISECEWWQFYDICEVIPRSLNPYFYDTVKADFYEKANILFKNEKLGFEITNEGMVERADTCFTDANLKKARYLLKDPQFKEANEHFERVLKEACTSTRLDGEKYLKEALLSIESVARRINNSDKNTSSFNEIIDNLTQKGKMPRQVDRVLRNIYISLGDLQRGTYGMSGLDIESDEAEFVLALTAAIITYLVNRGHQSDKAPESGGQQPLIKHPTITRS